MSSASSFTIDILCTSNSSCPIVYILKVLFKKLLQICVVRNMKNYMPIWDSYLSSVYITGYKSFENIFFGISGRMASFNYFRTNWYASVQLFQQNVRVASKFFFTWFFTRLLPSFWRYLTQISRFFSHLLLYKNCTHKKIKIK